MRCKPSSCDSCILKPHGSDFSAVEGTGANGVLLVGEASGQMEQRDQLPFRPYAPAGSVLERCLRRMGLSRQSFSISNCVRCRPRHDFLDDAPWEYSALRSCRPNLDQVIAERKPRVIVALGGIALRELTGEAGEARGITHLAGYVLPLQHSSYSAMLTDEQNSMAAAKARGIGNIPIIGDFHPSYLRRGKASHQGVFSRILQRALNIAKGTDREWLWNIDPEECSTWNTVNHNLNYWTHPTLDQCVSVLNYLRDNPQVVIAKDLETHESISIDEDARDGFQDTEIRTFQLSLQAGTGMSIPYVDPFRDVIRALVALPNRFYGHNWASFDHKVLRASAAREGWLYAGVGDLYDTLDMFHHWQPDLPAHLQFCASFIRFPFPWKHLAATDIEFYGIADVDADLRLGLWLEQMLKKDGIWDDTGYTVSPSVGQESVLLPQEGLNYNAALNGTGHSVPPGSSEAQQRYTRGYLGQVREVRPVLAAMEDRGVPVDDTRRMALGAGFDEAQRKLGAEIAARAPKECQRVHPKEGYAGVAPQVKAFVEGKLGDKQRAKSLLMEHAAGTMVRTDIFDLLAVERFQDPPTKNKYGTEEEGEWYTYQRRTFTITSATAELTTTDESVERWCRIYDFNPNSSQQLIQYMKAKHHPVPKSKEEDDEGKQKETTAAKELQRLAVKTGDDFYLKVIEYRGYTKLKGTYVEGFKPQADGRVHPTFTFDTGTGQLSARNPNSTNFPKLKPTPELAKAMRGMIVAPKGRVIVDWDYKSCHALTLGYLAESPRYMRMARLDIHSFVAGHFLGLWDAYKIEQESDAQLKARFKWLKSDPERKQFRDDQAKHCILGIGFGLGAKGLYERYMDDFHPRPCRECQETGKVRGLRGMKKCTLCDGSGKQSGRSVAEELHATVRRIFPEVFEWQKRMQDQAHREQFLRTEFGHIRRFYEVFRWDGKKSAWGHGDQAEEAIAFWPANIAFGHIREALKELSRRGLDEKWHLFNHIHDSFDLAPMVHAPNVSESLMDEHRKEIAEVLLRPSEVLTNPKVAPGGLVIDVEAAWGKEDWAHMEELEVPRVMQEVSCVGA